jgi:hypothetical protein
MVCIHKYPQVKHNKRCMELGGQHASGEITTWFNTKISSENHKKKKFTLCVCIIVYQIYGWKQKRKIQWVNYMRMPKCDHHPIFHIQFMLSQHELIKLKFVKSCFPYFLSSF